MLDIQDLRVRDQALLDVLAHRCPEHIESLSVSVCTDIMIEENVPLLHTIASVILGLHSSTHQLFLEQYIPSILQSTSPA